MKEMEEGDELDYQIYKSFQILGRIGQGAYGRVYKVQERRTGAVYALKKIIDAFQNITDAKRTFRELNYLSQLHHPCIVTLHRVLPLDNTSTSARIAYPLHTTSFKRNINDQPQRKHTYALFQHMESDLKNIIQHCDQFILMHRQYIAFQLLKSVEYVHACGLLHRDIKPANILINGDNIEVKLCDFGLSRMKYSNNNKTNINNTNSMSSNINSYDKEDVVTDYIAARWYRPPEVLLGVSSCQQSIDMWSVGCVLAQLLLKSPLFPGKSTLDQLERIVRAVGMPSSKEIAGIPSQKAQYLMRNFSFSKKLTSQPLRQMLSAGDPREIQLICLLLSFAPGNRISASQALSHPYFNAVRHINPALNIPFEPIVIREPNLSLKTSLQQYRELIDALAKGEYLHSASVIDPTNINSLKQINMEMPIQEIEHTKDQESTSQRQCFLKHPSNLNVVKQIQDRPIAVYKTCCSQNKIQQHQQNHKHFSTHKLDKNNIPIKSKTKTRKKSTNFKQNITNNIKLNTTDFSQIFKQNKKPKKHKTQHNKNISIKNLITHISNTSNNYTHIYTNDNNFVSNSQEKKSINKTVHQAGKNIRSKGNTLPKNNIFYNINVKNNSVINSNGSLTSASSIAKKVIKNKNTSKITVQKFLVVKNNNEKGLKKKPKKRG